MSSTPMNPRTRSWLIALAVVDAITWILTLRSHFDYHAGKHGPTVMSVGQLLGWFVSIVLLALIVVILFETRRARRRGPGRPAA